MDGEEVRKHREEEQKLLFLAVDLAIEQVIRKINSNGSISHIIPSQSLMDLSSSPSAQTQPAHIPCGDIPVNSCGLPAGVMPRCARPSSCASKGMNSHMGIEQGFPTSFSIPFLHTCVCVMHQS